MVTRRGLQQVMSSELPLYRQVEQDLRARIQSGEWTIGAMLPGRKSLAKTYGVDLRTLQRAIAGLLEDGTLQATDRRGTFVAQGTTGVTVETVPSITLPAGLPPSLNLPTTTQKPLTIGIIAPCGLGEVVNNEPRSPWVYSLLSMLESDCSKQGDFTRFGDLLPIGSEKLNSAQATIQSLVADGIDGLIVIDIHDNSGLYEEISQTPGIENLPVAYIACRDILGPFPHVFYDNRYAGYQAAEHMLQVGFRDIWFFSPSVSVWADERWEGAYAAIKQSGYSCRMQLFPEKSVAPPHKYQGAKEDPATIEFAHQFIKQHLTNIGPDPVGIIVSHDEAGYLLIELAQRENIIAGRDFGIIGFDDRRRSRLYGLTSLRPPLETLATTALQMLRGVIQGDTIPRQVRLTSELVVRASTMCQQLV